MKVLHTLCNHLGRSPAHMQIKDNSPPVAVQTPAQKISGQLKKTIQLASRTPKAHCTQLSALQSSGKPAAQTRLRFAPFIDRLWQRASLRRSTLVSLSRSYLVDDKTSSMQLAMCLGDMKAFCLKHPRDTFARLLLSLLYFRMGDQYRARREVAMLYEASHKRDPCRPYSPSLSVMAAYMYIAQRDEESKEFALEAYEIDPDNAQAQSILRLVGKHQDTIYFAEGFERLRRCISGETPLSILFCQPNMLDPQYFSNP